MPRKSAARPSPRRAARLFEIGRYWLGRERHADTISYYWYDASARRTRRTTTGLTDLEEAKVWLAALVLRESPDKPHTDPSQVTIAAIRAYYWEHHGSRIRSSNLARLAFKLIGAFMGTQKLEGAPKVGDFDLARQELFMRWCAAQRGLSAKSISTYLTYYKAALRFAARPRMIPDGRGGHSQAQWLEVAPYVAAGENEVAKVTGQRTSAPREFVPTDIELAKVIDAIQTPHVRRYVIMALNTWARPEAIIELRVKAQVDFERSLVHLNQPGRVQNNKIRPTIRLTQNLRGWLIHWNVDAPIAVWTKDGRSIPVKHVSARTIKNAAEAAGVPNASLYNRYTLRHYMATRSRSVPGFPVSREQRAEWMGHLDPTHRTTQGWYESLDPDHLADAAAATDAIMERLARLCRTPIEAPAAADSRLLRVIEGRERVAGSE